MKKSLIPLFIFMLMLSYCKKSETDFIWERSYGEGEALFLRSSSDSGIIACGEISGKPYLIRLGKNRNIKIEISGENPGLFSSVWSDTSGYITGGSSDGKMLLMRHSMKGTKLWELSFDGGFKVDFTKMFYEGNGNLLALGTASADSSDSGATGLLLVRFDTTGQIISENNIPETAFVSAQGAALDIEGNLYLALTRQGTGAKPKASIAKFNDLFQKLWETELYNNPNFGAASLSIILDANGNIYASGKTELSTEGDILNNSFLASLTNAGSVRWKKYLENSNAGSAIIFDDPGDVMMLNENCFIINIANQDNGSETGRIRMFGVCDPYNTDAFGSDFDVNYDGNIMVAGQRGGNFYLALKSSGE
jgi:hypothetical protein